MVNSFLMDYKAAVAHWGSDFRLKKALDAHEVFKCGEGVYSSKDNPPKEAVLCFRYPRAVITMKSAYFLHGLTDEIPEAVDIAIPSSGRAPTIEGVNVHYSPKGFHDRGVITLEIHGFSIRTYSKERLLIELLRGKESIPYDLYKEIIQRYRRIADTLDFRLLEDCLIDFPKARLIKKRLDEEVL